MMVTFSTVVTNSPAENPKSGSSNEPNGKTTPEEPVHERPGASVWGVSTPLVLGVLGLALLIFQICGSLTRACYDLQAKYCWGNIPQIEAYALSALTLRQAGISFIVMGFLFAVLWPGNLKSPHAPRQGLTGENEKLTQVEKSSKLKFIKFCDLHGVQLIVIICGIAVLLGEPNVINPFLSLFSVVTLAGSEAHGIHSVETLHHLASEFGIALFVAGLVSYIFDVSYHERTFGKPVEEMKTQVGNITEQVGVLGGQVVKLGSLETQVGSLGTQVTAFGTTVGNLGAQVGTITTTVGTLKTTADGLDISVNKLTNQMGFVNYRNEVRKSYQDAQKRIVSIADYWLVDREWWGEGNGPHSEWEECPLYKALIYKPESGKSARWWPQEIVFAGKVPWPRRQDLDGLLRLEPVDFQRFLGVAWRLVVAHKVREYSRISENRYPGMSEPQIKVLVARVPMAATIVDDRVFLLLEEPKDLTLSHGSELTGYEDPEEEPSETKRRKKNIADSYYTLINGYLHHAHSGREYIEAMLCSSMAAAGFNEQNPLTRDTTERCLNQLGMSKWAKHECEKGTDFAQGKNADTLCIHAVDIVYEYLRTLKYLNSEMTFEQIKNDLL